MWGEQIEYPFLRRNDEISYYFDEEDVMRIFSVIANIKHLAMFQTLFYGCLRATKLCNLDDEDVDLNRLKLRVRQGKGGRDGIVLISNTCANTLQQYLKVRPRFEINGRQPLFYTDYGNRWTKRGLLDVFLVYKKKAGIKKRGSLHVFARHTTATIMIAKGFDLRIVKEILRHKDIRTTLRYAHVSDTTKRTIYDKFLTV